MMRSSYSKEDVTILLKDITGQEFEYNGHITVIR